MLALFESLPLRKCFSSNCGAGQVCDAKTLAFSTSFLDFFSVCDAQQPVCVAGVCLCVIPQVFHKGPFSIVTRLHKMWHS